MLNVHVNQSASLRKSQVGTGMRGDKIRTYRYQDDTCCDHRNDNKVSLKKVMSGNIDLFW